MAPYTRRLGLISLQVRAHDALPWETVDRVDNPREAAGRSQGLSSHHVHVRVVDRQGNVRIRYEAGVRVDHLEPPPPATPDEAPPPVGRKLYGSEERRRLDGMRASRENRIRTVVVNGVEFVSIWDGKGPIPGTRLPGEW